MAGSPGQATERAPCAEARVARVLAVRGLGVRKRRNCSGGFMALVISSFLSPRFSFLRQH